MTDDDKALVERLRNRIWYTFEGTHQVRESDADAHAAADRIEAQAAEIERLREALGSIARNSCCDKCQEAALVARKALGETE